MVAMSRTPPSADTRFFRPYFCVLFFRCVSDGAARKFANVFYSTLFEKGRSSTVKQAFDMALNCVNAAHLGAPNYEEDLFLLLPTGKNKF